MLDSGLAELLPADHTRFPVNASRTNTARPRESVAAGGSVSSDAAS